MKHTITHELKRRAGGSYTLTIETDCYSEIAADKQLRFFVEIDKRGNRWFSSSPHDMSAKALYLPSLVGIHTLKETVENIVNRVDLLINKNLADMENPTFYQNSGGFFVITAKFQGWHLYFSCNPRGDNRWMFQAYKEGQPTLTETTTARFAMATIAASAIRQFNILTCAKAQQKNRVVEANNQHA